MAGPTVLKAFDGLIEEARSEGLQRHSGEHAGTLALRQGPEPVLTLGTYPLTDADRRSRQRRGMALPASMLLHGAAATALAVVPLLLADTLPGQGSAVHAFFVEPISAPAPPPPPPPAPARASAAPTVAPKAIVQTGFTAPIEVPTEIRPEEGVDLGIEGGVPGGVEGGIPGGVVGGLVGGLPDAPPPPPLKPVHVGGDIRAPRKVVDVTAVYPPLAIAARIQGVVIIEATLDPRGRVQNATVLRSVPMLDEAALAAVRQWVYTPTLLNGVPTPIIMTVTVTFRLNTV
jgi:protein TonB